MIYGTIGRDLFYESASSALTYYISEASGSVVYNGIAFRSPNEAVLRINITRRVKDYLEAVAFDYRGFTGVVPQPSQMGYFNLYDGEGNLLEEYCYLYGYGRWNGQDAVLSEPINCHADPREYIFATTVGASARTVNYGNEDEDYLTFDILSGGTLGWIRTNTAVTTTDPSYFIEASVNKGAWTTLDTATTLTLQAGDTVRFRGNRTGYYDANANGSYYFGSNGTLRFNVRGRLLSLTKWQEMESPNAFEFLFYNKGVIDASSLILPDSARLGCYYRMFENCSLLEAAPRLVASRIASDCYARMFRGCTSLVYPPYMNPAATANSSGLTLIPSEAYLYMFSGCTSLTSAPELPADYVGSYSYYQMFAGCTSLTAAPYLPNNLWTGRTQSYAGMFSGCTSLNYIHCDLLSGTTADTANWVAGVASAGTFVRDENAMQWTSGVNGIPKGWIISPEYVSDSALTFDILSGGTIQLWYNGGGADSSYKSIEIYKDGMPYATLSKSAGVGQYSNAVEVYAGEKYLLAGAEDGKNMVDIRFSGSTIGGSGTTAEFNLSGNLSSLMRGTPDGTGDLTDLFGHTKVHSAENLIMPDLTKVSVNYLFAYSSLETAPELPVAYVPDGAYNHMFYGCSSLNYIHCEMLSGTTGDTYEWVKNVASAGTFVRNENATFWERGINGIPVGWIVDPPYEAPASALTFDIISGGTLGFTINPDSGLYGPEDYRKIYIYKNGAPAGVFTWDNSAITVEAGDKIVLVGVDDGHNCRLHQFMSTGVTFNLSGNISSLMTEPMVWGEFCYFFEYTGVVDAGNLVLPEATSFACFERMFRGCTNLTAAPELPTKNLPGYAYYEMFRQCRNLIDIKCYAETWESDSTQNWTKYEPDWASRPAGTFTKKRGVVWSTGDSGIPNGWTVVEVD